MFVVVKNLLSESLESNCDYIKINAASRCRLIVGKGKGYANIILRVLSVEI